MNRKLGLFVSHRDRRNELNFDPQTVRKLTLRCRPFPRRGVSCPDTHRCVSVARLGAPGIDRRFFRSLPRSRPLYPWLRLCAQLLFPTTFGLQCMLKDTDERFEKAFRARISSEQTHQDREQRCCCYPAIDYHSAIRSGARSALGGVKEGHELTASRNIRYPGPTCTRTIRHHDLLPKPSGGGVLYEAPAQSKVSVYTVLPHQSKAARTMS